MDVVYIVSDFDDLDFLELRYSIRSLEKYMQDLGDIYIVGKLPDWLGGIKHIAVPDKFPELWMNSLIKVQFASMAKPLSREFLFMNDDFYAFAPFVGKDLPAYRLPLDIEGVDGPYNFRVHCPMVLNKENIVTLDVKPNKSGRRSWRSLYGNTFCKNTVVIPDTLITNDPDFFQDPARSFVIPFAASTNDIASSDWFQKNMLSLFPQKSSFEK